MKDFLYIEKFTEYGLPYIEVQNVDFFETKHIFECGQCFRWNPVSNTKDMYVGVAGGHLAAISTENVNGSKNVILANVTKADFEAFWKNYFDFAEDYGAICNELSQKDEYLKRAVEFGEGIRILRQEFFETLISFILSANNNIPRIKGCVEKICGKYGSEIKASKEFVAYIKQLNIHALKNEEYEKNCIFYSFPTAEQLKSISAQDYSDTCKAGYRCAYLEATVKKYIEKTKNDDIFNENICDLEMAEKMIQEYSGVGPKVASCILLFSGQRKDVFPIDVWVRRVLEGLYFKRTVNTKEARAFVREYFGNMAGFAQQYLFYYMREKGDSYDID